MNGFWDGVWLVTWATCGGLLVWAVAEILGVLE